ncbi:MAG: YceI family protein [Saprospiraceae bacterium]
MKTTIKLLGFVLITAAIAVSCGSGTEADEVGQVQDVAEMVGGTYAVDTDASVINWRGEKFSGDFHTGTVAIKDGELAVENGAITGGNFTIDMTNMTVTDEMPEKKKAGLLGHLQGTKGNEGDADFFQITKYPTASFEITSVKGNEVSGNLTMLDSTHNVTFTTTTSIEDGKLTASTEDFTFDRTLWGITFMSSSLEGMVKEKALKDEITISISLTANEAGAEGEAASDEATEE